MIYILLVREKIILLLNLVVLLSIYAMLVVHALLHGFATALYILSLWLLALILALALRPVYISEIINFDS